ncbi:HTH domain-containing protein [Faecalicatena orotica]
MTQTAMAEELGITSRAVKKSIKELNEKGMLKRVGSARSGYWEVKDN